MSIFDQLAGAAAKSGLRFLVIGGHAVIRHGYLRATQDVDLLIAKEDRPRWESLVRQLGYSVFHDGGTFLQLSPANGAGWELDLMLVSRQTLEKMLAEAQASDIGGAPVLIPTRNQDKPNVLVWQAPGFVARSLQPATGMRLARASSAACDPSHLSLTLIARWNHSQPGAPARFENPRPEARPGRARAQRLERCAGVGFRQLSGRPGGFLSRALRETR